MVAKPVMKEAMGDGVKIQLAVWEGDGKTVLCVHGLTANCRCWDLIASALTPNHRLLAMDLRGRGLSDSPPSGYSVRHHCGDILSLVEALNVDRLVLMGHSLGAFISLLFAAQHPEKVEGLILVDGGGKLSEDQMTKVFAGIKPSLDRLGQTFPSFESYISLLKQAPFLKPWNSHLETYFRYEVREVEGGFCSRVDPHHIAEEVVNLKQVDPGHFYGNVFSPTLILRATKGMLAKDDLLLPEEVVERMVREIPRAIRVDLEETNHYSILFEPNMKRDQAILNFLETI